MARPVRWCTIKNCKERHEARGLCRIHYSRQRRGAPLNGTRIYNGTTSNGSDYGGIVCLEAGCESLARTRGRCQKHYKKTLSRQIKLMALASCGGKCTEYGADNLSVSAYHFHHVDPMTKVREVSDWARVCDLNAALAEAAKCIILCANCHADETWKTGRTIRHV